MQKNRAFWNSTSDAYQAAHGEILAQTAMAWGVWRVPESALNVLGDVAGRDVLELGCGAAQWAIALASQGARACGVDLSERQLAHARARVLAAQAGVGLVQASAEHLPFPSA